MIRQWLFLTSEWLLIRPRSLDALDLIAHAVLMRCIGSTNSGGIPISDCHHVWGARPCQGRAYGTNQVPPLVVFDSILRGIKVTMDRSIFVPEILQGRLVGLRGVLLIDESEQLRSERSKITYYELLSNAFSNTAYWVLPKRLKYHVLIFSRCSCYLLLFFELTTSIRPFLSERYNRSYTISLLICSIYSQFKWQWTFFRRKSITCLFQACIVYTRDWKIGFWLRKSDDKPSVSTC